MGGIFKYLLGFPHNKIRPEQSDWQLASSNDVARLYQAPQFTLVLLAHIPKNANKTKGQTTSGKLEKHSESAVPTRHIFFLLLGIFSTLSVY